MFEILGLLAIIAVAGLVLGCVALCIGLIKVVFKIALIPISLGLLALKGVAFLVVGLVALVVLGPIVLGIGLAILVPVLILGAIVWAGVALL